MAFGSRPPGRVSGELCRRWGAVPAGSEGLRLDGGMDARGRVCLSEGALHTHREESHAPDLCPP